MAAKRKYNEGVSDTSIGNKAACVDEKDVPSNFIVKIQSIFLYSDKEYTISLPDEPRVLDLYLGISTLIGLHTCRIVFSFNGKAVPEICSVLLSTLGISHGSTLSASAKSVSPGDEPFRAYMDHFMICGRTQGGNLSASGHAWDLSFTPGHPEGCDCVVKTNRNIRPRDGFDLSILGEHGLSPQSFGNKSIQIIDLSTGKKVDIDVVTSDTFVYFETSLGLPWTMGEMHQIHFNPNAGSYLLEHTMHLRTHGAPLSRASQYRHSLVLQFMPMSYYEQECLTELRQCVFLNQKIDPLLWIVISYLFFPTL